MHTKLTLRMEDTLIREAKKQAVRRGKSVSGMFGDFVGSLETRDHRPALPPTTTALLGIMKGRQISEEDYRRHLQEKHR
jgi:hypothetical protein